MPASSQTKTLAEQGSVIMHAKKARVSCKSHREQGSRVSHFRRKRVRFKSRRRERMRYKLC